jgi:hypothetical protein
MGRILISVVSRPLRLRASAAAGHGGGAVLTGVNPRTPSAGTRAAIAVAPCCRGGTVAVPSGAAPSLGHLCLSVCLPVCLSFCL